MPESRIPPRRVLFVSEVMDGGSPRSQRELASMLRLRGHDVRFLVSPETRAPRLRTFYGKATNASVRFQHTPAGPLLARLRDVIGSRTHDTTLNGIPHKTTAVVQNALPAVISSFAPDVVVVSSVSRWAWRRIAAVCDRTRTSTILYVREDVALRHLETGAMPDALVANASSLRDALTAQGHECDLIPSVVDIEVTRTASTRRVVLAINPDPTRGSAIFWAVAARLPQIPFVMQESWLIDGPLLTDVQKHVSELPNVEFRRQVGAGPALYQDAKAIMVPYRVNNRPRVILEAQSNGIPVIAGDTPGLVEAVGDGGVIVPLESIDAWAEAIEGLWHDEAHYANLARSALAHSLRPEVNPESLTDQFEDLMERAIDRAKDR